uniref:Luciferin 4-monooxygenase n=1 Tax=Aquatica lateralis TaxID=7052 RepID=L8B3T0_AQULA|nr:luciferase [Aquatica lateralis]
MNKNILYGPPPVHPLDDGTGGEQLYKCILKYAQIPGCIALTSAHTKENMLYKDLLQSTCRLAESLKKYGITTNSTIAVCSENNLQYFIPVIAALYIGAATAAVNDKYNERELINCLNLSKPTFLFCSKETWPKIRQAKKKLDFIKKIIILDNKNDSDSPQSLENFIFQNCDKDFNVSQFKPNIFNRDEHVALILNSSGSSGLPKGVMLTHKNLAVRFCHCKDPIFGNQISPGTAILTVIPFHHGFGMFTTLGYFTCGFRIVLMHTFEEHLFLQSLQDYKVKSTLLVPTLMTFFAKSPLVDKFHLPYLHEIASGGAPLSKEIGEAVALRFKLKSIRQGYGLTETTSAILLTPEGEIVPGSTGKVVPFFAAKVVDNDTGRILGPNKVGELCFKGDMNMKGYCNDIKATNAIIDKEGWLHSGDLGYYDENEHFFIVDRLKSLIKYKGYQVAPAELEGILLTHPSIMDAGVTGIPDEHAGELPAACVVVKPGRNLTEENVINYVSSQVSSSKRLRGGVRFIDNIPKGSTGKIDTKALKQILQKQKSKL